MVSDSRWRIGPALPLEVFREVRHRAIFECCKWDPQVEDTSVLCPFPFLLKRSLWRELASTAEALDREMLAAEKEISRRPELLKHLGLSRPLRAVFEAAAEAGSAAGPVAAASLRVTRFDFHHTREGWRITEANSDVPGGFIEASGCARLVSGQFAGTSVVDPVAALCDALIGIMPQGGIVAMAHATAYTDDRQVMTFLSRELEGRGLRTVMVAPDFIRWDHGSARVEAPWFSGTVDWVYRFFPCEWLPNLPRESEWRRFFDMGLPMCNPTSALLSQSKRFPLVWDALPISMPTWRRCLPRTEDPRRVDWEDGHRWVLKPALGRVGEMIGLSGATPEREWKLIRKGVRRAPEYWAAQERFETTPMLQEERPYFLCLGVYTFNGQAAGLYGRISRNRLIDYRAQDIAVLIEEDEP